MIKLCPSSKAVCFIVCSVPNLYLTLLLLTGNVSMLTTPTYHSICKVLHYSEFLTQFPFLFKGLHLRLVIACAISVSSNTKWVLQDAGQSVPPKSKFHQLLWLSLEPNSGSGHQLSYITVVHIKEIQWLGVNPFCRGDFACLFHPSAAPLKHRQSSRTGSAAHDPIFPDTEDRGMQLEQDVD